MTKNNVAGYKITELGIIPEDWLISNILNNSILKARIGWQGLTTAEYLNSGNFYLVTGTDIIDGSVKWETCHYVHEARYTQDRNIQLKENDILVTKDGTIGKVAFIRTLKLPSTLNSGVFVIRPKNKEYLPRLLFYILKSRYFDNFLNQLVAGSTINHLYQKDFQKFNFVLPPTITEQTAIATVLSDTDNLIQSLEKLIEKKRMIKQGAMQELLKPKDGWKVRPFKDLCWFQEGPGLRKWQFTNQGMKVINVTNIENGILNLERTDRYISLDDFYKMYEHFEIEENDIVIASSGNSYGKVAVVRKQDLPLLMNTSVIRFQPTKGLEYDYLLVFLKSNHFKNQIDLLITGGAQPNFGPAHLNKIQINLPPKIEEQTRIATIISDMDTEIQALDTKLYKYRHIKQGIMQELLTGKTRLI